MHYVKIWSSILDGSLADDYETRHVYEDLLKLADADGVVDMTANAIAARLRAPVEIVRASIEKLSAPDPNSRTPDEDGRRIVLLGDRAWGWRIVNWHLYRHMRSKDDLREQTRIRVAAHRERNATSRDVTRRNAPSLDVTPGSRQKVEGKKKKELQDRPQSSSSCTDESTLRPPKGGGDLAPLEPRPAESGGEFIWIPVRKKAKSIEIVEVPIEDRLVSALEREYPGMNIREQLVEIRRWCLEQAEKPRRGLLWTSAMAGIHRWLRRGCRDARVAFPRGSPATNPRAAVDLAYLEANQLGAGEARAGPAEGDGDGEAADPIAEYLAGRVG